MHPNAQKLETDISTIFPKHPSTEISSNNSSFSEQSNESSTENNVSNVPADASCAPCGAQGAQEAKADINKDTHNIEANSGDISEDNDIAVVDPDSEEVLAVLPKSKITLVPTNENKITVVPRMIYDNAYTM